MKKTSKKEKKAALKKIKKLRSCPSGEQLRMEYIQYLKTHPDDRKITFLDWFYYRTTYRM